MAAPPANRATIAMVALFMGSPWFGRGRGPAVGRHLAKRKLNPSSTGGQRWRASVLDNPILAPAMANPIIAPLVGYASRLRFPTLFKITLGLMLLSWLLPDPLPFLDE